MDSTIAALDGAAGKRFRASAPPGRQATALAAAAAGITAGKQAAAQEGAFQRPVAMHAAAAKAGGLAGGVQSRHDVAVAAEHPGVEVGLEAAQRFPGQDVELDGDQGAMSGVENAVRRRRPDQPVADISPGVVDVHHLRILDVGIADLAIARLDLGLQMRQVEQAVAGQRIHAGNEIGEVVAHHKVGAMGLERLHRRRRAPVGGTPRGHQPALAGQIGILLGAGKGEFLLDDALGEHEP